MIPPTKRPGSVVVTRPASHGEVPGSNPGLVVLFSLTRFTIGNGVCHPTDASRCIETILLEES